MSASEPAIVELLTAVLQSMVGQLPMLLAYTVALIIVIVRWREAPRASTLALCGVLFGLFLAVVLPFLYVWLPRRITSSGNSMTEMHTLIGVISLAGSFAHAISFGFLFMAIYAGRRPPGSVAQY